MELIRPLNVEISSLDGAKWIESEAKLGAHIPVEHSVAEHAWYLTRTILVDGTDGWIFYLESGKARLYVTFDPNSSSVELGSGEDLQRCKFSASIAGIESSHLKVPGTDRYLLVDKGILATQTWKHTASRNYEWKVKTLEGKTVLPHLTDEPRTINVLEYQTKKQWGSQIKTGNPIPVMIFRERQKWRLRRGSGSCFTFGLLVDGVEGSVAILGNRVRLRTFVAGDKSGNFRMVSQEHQGMQVSDVFQLESCDLPGKFLQVGGKNILGLGENARSGYWWNIVPDDNNFTDLSSNPNTTLKPHIKRPFRNTKCVVL